LAPPFWLVEKPSGAGVPCQWEDAPGGGRVRWLVPSIPAGEVRSYVLQRGERVKAQGMTLRDGRSAGWIGIRNPDREVTRYHYGEQISRPHFYPLTAHGVAVTETAPKDHPHHTSVWFCHGEVNGKDYWSSVPIRHRRFLAKEEGGVYARIATENAWGEDLVEVQDVFVLDTGPDAVMDWTVTLRAEAGPVVFGQTKEGSFGVRVVPELQDAGEGAEIMSDALGNRGEPAIRAAAAPWVDYSGAVGGKRVGVAILNHPESFRAPTDWHVRAYGLFAANPFYVRGEHRLEKGESITLRYRLYVHAGDAAQGKVAEVYDGYACAKVTVE
jgi:hypothetical protein